MGRFDLFEALRHSLEFKDNDILIISSKFVSMSEGALVNLDQVKVSKRAKLLSDKFFLDPRLAELVIRESDVVFGGVPGFLLTVKDGILAPNAGIDRSNVPEGFAIIYPKDPFRSANNLRLRFLVRAGIKIGIIIADSRLMPTRIGTTGVAIGCSGFEPVEDQRGKKDLFGNILRVTFRAVADGFATTGVTVMGESDESTPAIIIRGACVIPSDRNLGWQDLAVEHWQDIYIRSLRCGRVKPI